MIDNVKINKLEDEEEEFQSSGDLNFRDSNGIYYIFGDIDNSVPRNIIAPLQNDIEQLKLIQNKKPIKMFINTRGGNVYTAFEIVALFEHAKANNIEIYTYVSSRAFSAGTVIACAGHKRFVGKRSCYMLHFARGYDYSTNPVMSERNNEHSNWMQDELIKIYQKYSNNKLKEKQLRNELLADSLFYNGSEAIIKCGLADEEF